MYVLFSVVLYTALRSDPVLLDRRAEPAPLPDVCQVPDSRASTVLALGASERFGGLRTVHVYSPVTNRGARVAMFWYRSRNHTFRPLSATPFETRTPGDILGGLGRRGADLVWMDQGGLEYDLLYHLSAEDVALAPEWCIVLHPETLPARYRWKHALLEKQLRNVSYVTVIEANLVRIRPRWS